MKNSYHFGTNIQSMTRKEEVMERHKIMYASVRICYKDIVMV